MGEVLAMKIRTSLMLACLAFAVSACGNTDDRKNFSPVRDIVQRVLLERQAGQKPATPGPYLSMTRLVNGAVITLTPLDVDGSVITWKSNSGAQLITRDGLLIATRGFGADLMSADAPSLATLLGGKAAYNRSYHMLDGTDTPVRLYFSCTTSAAAAQGVAGASRRIVEECQGEAGRITNEYWVSPSRKVVKSKQFASQMAGYFEIRALQN
jgi:hypothetical protein